MLTTGLLAAVMAGALCHVPAAAGLAQDRPHKEWMQGLRGGSR